MKLLSIATALLLTATGAAQAQNTFTIQSKGAAVGKCVYSFDKTKDGFKIVSRYQARTAGQFKESDAGDPITKNSSGIQQTHSFKLDAKYTYTGGNVVDSNSQITNGYSPNKQHTEMLLTTLQAGIQGPSKDLPLKDGYIVAPLYDAGAIQALVYQATDDPAPDNLYYFIVPQDPKSTPMSGQIKWVLLGETTGTLDGKSIPVHHYGFSYGKPLYNIYTNETNRLMQVDLSSPKISYVRNGFVLTEQ
jgi:hypothetical protein